MRIRCLACGHEFEDRIEQPRNRRQCGNCGRRRTIEMYVYRAAVDQAREMRRTQFDPKVSRETFASLIDALDPVSPQAALGRLLRGDLKDALDDPFIAAKAVLDIWKDACKEDEDDALDVKGDQK